jgi:hypothetical protein
MPTRSPKILPTHELNARRRRIAALKRLPALATPAPPPPKPPEPTPLARATTPAWLLPGKNQPPAAPNPP